MTAWGKCLTLFIVCFRQSLAAADARGATIFVQKCCKSHEILVDNACRNASTADQAEWKPEFYEMDGEARAQVKDFVVISGIPSCGSHQPWPIYHNFSDKLVLLRDGSLRHTLYHDTHIEDAEVLKVYDYKINLYCFEKKYDTSTNKVSQYALVCAPEVPIPWLETYLIQKVFVRVCYSMCIILFLIYMIITFVASWRDKNVVLSIYDKIHTCIFVSLLCYNTAAFVNTFHEYFTDETVLTFDIIMHMGFLGAFLWVSCIGHHYWRVSRSPHRYFHFSDLRWNNEYLIFVLSTLFTITAVAIFAHFTLETDKELETHTLYEEASRVGWLGVALFWFPIFISVMVNTYWVCNMRDTPFCGCLSFRSHTMRLIAILTVAWVFLFLSLAFGHIFYYTNVLVNFIASFLLLVQYFWESLVSFARYYVCPAFCCCLKNERRQETSPEIALNLIT